MTIGQVSRIFDEVKFFFETRVLVRGVFGVTGIHALFEFFNVAYLAFVFQDRFDLSGPGVGDIDHNVGRVRQRTPDFVRHVRLITLGQQFRKISGIASSREDGIQNHLTGRAMIGVVDSVGGEKQLRIARDQDIGLQLANNPHHITTQGKIGDQVAVRTIKKVNCLSADGFRCGGLFFMPDRTQVIRIDIFGFGQVVITLVATSQQVIRDLVSSACPTSKGGAAKKFRVVGMG